MTEHPTDAIAHQIRALMRSIIPAEVQHGIDLRLRWRRRLRRREARREASRGRRGAIAVPEN
jgi:hypothetical protein